MDKYHASTIASLPAPRARSPLSTRSPACQLPHAIHHPPRITRHPPSTDRHGTLHPPPVTPPTTPPLSPPLRPNLTLSPPRSPTCRPLIHLPHPKPRGTRWWRMRSPTARPHSKRRSSSRVPRRSSISACVSGCTSPRLAGRRCCRTTRLLHCFSRHCSASSATSRAVHSSHSSHVSAYHPPRSARCSPLTTQFDLNVSSSRYYIALLQEWEKAPGRTTKIELRKKVRKLGFQATDAEIDETMGVMAVPVHSDIDWKELRAKFRRPDGGFPGVARSDVACSDVARSDVACSAGMP